MGVSATDKQAPDDEELAAAIGAGDERAFTLLYERYGLLAYNLAYRILGDGGTAEDVVQEVFFSLWRRRATFDRARGSLRNWLLASIHHRAVSRLRGTAGRTRQDYPLDNLANVALTDDPWPAVETNLLRETVERSLATLPPDQRRAIELAYLVGHTRSAIAEALGIPLGTVKGRLRMGLGKLRLALADPTAPLGGDTPYASPS